MEKGFGSKIISLIFLVLAGMLLAGLLSSLFIAKPDLIQDYDFSSMASRNKFRIVLLLGHLFSFLIPGTIYIYVHYKPVWIEYLSPKKELIAQSVFLCLLFLFVAYPLVAYGAVLNSNIPFPESFQTMDENTLQTMMGILQMDHFFEFIFSILLIAILPALGEELLFRGILQNEIERKTSNGHLSIWIAAFVFGIIHLQAESFIPKIMLGLILGYCYYWTKNIWVPIILHFVNNGFQVLAIYLAGDQFKALEEMEAPQVPVWSAFISLILVYWVGNQIIKLNSPPINEPRT